MTGRADYLELGDWNVVCYFCGFKRKASTLKKYWQGFYVCDTCWEPRQAQDFARSVPDVETPPWTQPASVIYGASCFPNDSCAVPGYMTPGCALPNTIAPMNTIPGFSNT